MENENTPNLLNSDEDKSKKGKGKIIIGLGKYFLEIG